MPRIYTKVENQSKAERDRWQQLAASQRYTLSALIRKLIAAEMDRAKGSV